MRQFGFSASCGQFINSYIIAEREQNIAEMQRIQQMLAAQGITCPNIPALPAFSISFLPPSGTGGITIPQHYLIGGSVLLVLVLFLALK